MRKALIIISVVIGLVALWFGIGFWTLIEEGNAELRSVVVRAKILDNQNLLNSSEYKVRFKYDGLYYRNAFQAYGRVFAKNDSVTVKIDSKNPLEYCELIY
jgi:uncharacterized protein YdgA (DUF945 family)